MKKIYSFGKGIDNADFFYCYSTHAKTFEPFVQEEDCVKNTYRPELKYYDYIGLLTRKRYSFGTKVTVECSFEKAGAPLILLSDDIQKNGQGRNVLGLHFEAVAYANGCNVWHILPFPERQEYAIKPTKIDCLEFSVRENERVEIEVVLQRNAMSVRVQDKVLTVKNTEIPEKCHVGFTACEGICRFYKMTVETAGERK